MASITKRPFASLTRPNRSASPASGSVALTAATSVPGVAASLSAVTAGADSTGASFALRTVTRSACCAVPRVVPAVALALSLTCTVSSYRLSASASVARSKLGAAMKLTTPVRASMLNNAASAPPTIE